MAKLGEVIAMVDEIKPNAFSYETKTAWLNECEGMVQTEVFLFAPVEIIQYRWPEDREKPMLVEPPHDKLYWAYLTAMIDFANGEYNKYQNTMQMFNASFGEFMRWFALNYRPADAHGEGTAMINGRGDWHGYYFTAYGIAVKHGFAGTEEEWLASLKGERGPGTMLRYDLDREVLEWSYEDQEDWQELLDINDLRGQVVALTLAAAQEAHRGAEAAKETAQTARLLAEQAAENAAEKAAEGVADRAVQAAESAAKKAAAAAAALGAQAIRDEVRVDVEKAEAARSGAEAAEDAVAAAAQAAEKARIQAEDAQTGAETALENVVTARDAARAAQVSAEKAGADAVSAQEDAENAQIAAEVARQAAEAAQVSAGAAAGTANTQAVNAAQSAQQAGDSAKGAADRAMEARSWAVGGTGTREGEDTDNAKYWAQNAKNIAGGGVTSFNGRGGDVLPEAGDYTAEQVGARPDDWVPSAEEVKADPVGTAEQTVEDHDKSAEAHADIRRAAETAQTLAEAAQKTAEGRATMEQVDQAIQAAIQAAVLDSWEGSY